MKIDKIQITVRADIPADRIGDLIVGAIEGGSNYWAHFRFPGGWVKHHDNYYDIPMNGGAIVVMDIETNERLGELNEYTVRRGLQMMADGKDINGKKIPLRHFKNFAMENDDVETADVFMQLAVMGEVVYG